jgi:hypothetical protein
MLLKALSFMMIGSIGESVLTVISVVPLILVMIVFWEIVGVVGISHWLVYYLSFKLGFTI